MIEILTQLLVSIRGALSAVIGVPLRALLRFARYDLTDWRPWRAVPLIAGGISIAITLAALKGFLGLSEQVADYFAPGFVVVLFGLLPRVTGILAIAFAIAVIYTVLAK